MMASSMSSVRAGTLQTPNLDGLIYVAADVTGKSAPKELVAAITTSFALDSSFSDNITIIPVNLPSRRLIFSPVGNLTDYDDVRSFSEAAVRGINRALQAGVKTPLLIIPRSVEFPKADLVTLLGALEALYVPLQLREDVPEKAKKVDVLYVMKEDGTDISDLVTLAGILESGRFAARDIGGGDPERMTALRIQEYVQNLFKDTPDIKIEIVDKVEVLEKEYPLFAAVNRAASVIERHRGRIIYLRYEPSGEITNSYYLVGKGITYDTGGVDLKVNGIMVGMSRDKCGAAAVAGFFKILAQLKPKGTRFIGAMCLARNSIGENAYVSDEVITARSGARVRVHNTDAEGRMVMADVLCKLKEEAIGYKNSHLMTIATLTGHAVITVGKYTILMDNSVAFKEGYSSKVQSATNSYGDLIEVSTIRREDIAYAKGKWEGDDCHQSGPQPSSRSQRGHQGPAGFLIKASGLDKFGLKAATPLKYTHLDIAGSAGDPPAECTGAPIVALYAAFLS